MKREKVTQINKGKPRKSSWNKFARAFKAASSVENKGDKVILKVGAVVRVFRIG